MRVDVTEIEDLPVTIEPFRPGDQCGTGRIGFTVADRLAHIPGELAECYGVLPVIMVAAEFFTYQQQEGDQPGCSEGEAGEAPAVIDLNRGVAGLRPYL